MCNHNSFSDSFKKSYTSLNIVSIYLADQDLGVRHQYYYAALIIYIYV